MKFVLLLILLLPSYFCVSYTQEINDEFLPWEAEDLNIEKKIDKNTSVEEVILNPIISLIELYQEKISSNSIHRCPFLISCSNYAKLSFKKHGIKGLFIFLDRHFFRENKQAYNIYKKVLSKGVLKLDDSFYLQ